MPLPCHLVSFTCTTFASFLSYFYHCSSCITLHSSAHCFHFFSLILCIIVHRINRKRFKLSLDTGRYKFSAWMISRSPNGCMKDIYIFGWRRVWDLELEGRNRRMVMVAVTATRTTNDRSKNGIYGETAAALVVIIELVASNSNSLSPPCIDVGPIFQFGPLCNNREACKIYTLPCIDRI